MKRNLFKVRITKRMDPKKRKAWEKILSREFDNHEQEFCKALKQAWVGLDGFSPLLRTKLSNSTKQT